MDSLKKLADEQLDRVRKSKADGSTRVKAALDRKHVKGLRGVLDLEEMSQLVRRVVGRAGGAAPRILEGAVWLSGVLEEAGVVNGLHESRLGRQQHTWCSKQ